MKKKFNIYVGLLIAAVVLGVGLDTSRGLYMGYIGAKAGWEQAKMAEEGQVAPTSLKENVDRIQNMVPIEMMPKNMLSMDFGDSIVNKKTGEKMPIAVLQTIAFPKEKSYSKTWLEGVGYIGIAIMIAFWVFFIKLIVAVNKGRIFEKNTETCLTWGGWMVLATYLLGWVSQLGIYLNNIEAFDFDKYNIMILEAPQTSLLYTAFGLLLMGQIFKIGRQMKEEQELTI